MAGRERDLERLLTFVDAVVAIAITLLVLPLAEIARDARNGLVVELLRQHEDDLLAFALSFIVIARLWLAQHAIVRPLVRQNDAVLRLLLTWTFTIVFLPFPTAVVTATSDDPVAKILYIGTMALSSVLLALIARTIGRDRTLRDTDTVPGTAQSIAISITFLVALVVSLSFPAAGYWPLLLLVLTDPIVRRLRTTPVGHGRDGP